MKVNNFIKINYKLNMKLFFGDFIIFNKLIKKINNCIKKIDRIDFIIWLINIVYYIIVNGMVYVCCFYEWNV